MADPASVEMYPDTWRIEDWRAAGRLGKLRAALVGPPPPGTTRTEPVRQLPLNALLGRVAWLASWVTDAASRCAAPEGSVVWGLLNFATGSPAATARGPVEPAFRWLGYPIEWDCAYGNHRPASRGASVRAYGVPAVLTDLTTTRSVRSTSSAPVRPRCCGSGASARLP